MAEAGRPAVYTIPVHRNFADALVAGLIAQTRGDTLALARALILLPNNRAIKAVTDAFVRRAEKGLLLPRLVAIGDLGDAMPRALFDGADQDPVPPAVDPVQRALLLARLIQHAQPHIDGAEALRLATPLANALDTLQAEDVAPEALRALDLSDALSVHWQKSLALFAILLDQWPGTLEKAGVIDLTTRRNLVLRRAAATWRSERPDTLIVAAGITTAAPAIAELQELIARLAHGMVVLPGVDLDCPDDEWAAIATGAIESHPQHHLRLVLDGIRVSRSDVQSWRWGDGRKARLDRARAVANAFAPAAFTGKWMTLPSAQTRLPAVRMAEFATPAEEAQGIAIALREAIELPERTAALITPDRQLAERVAAHLRRWGIDADDSAGRALSLTPPGVLILTLAQAAVERFAPVALLSLLNHPLVMAGEGRLDWLAGVRALDLTLRGPRPAPGLAGIATVAEGNWWSSVSEILSPLEAAFATEPPVLDNLIEALRLTLDDLTDDTVWAGPAGRAAAALFDDLARYASAGPELHTTEALPTILRQMMDGIAIRPPQGGHPRISIWGLLEARLQSADLLVLGGLNDGVWPASPTPDPWLSPKVRVELGLGGIDRRIGLAAHDLATALGGPEVLLTRARRDARSPTIASRFLLRLRAMTSELPHDDRLVALASAIDRSTTAVARASRPAPAPPIAVRPRAISVTDVERIQTDPFAFYAKTILKLRPLDPVDADTGPKWRGTAVHALLDGWTKSGSRDPEQLMARVAELLNASATHPMVRALWGPRLTDAIGWICNEIASDAANGRTIVASELRGAIDIAGVRLHGIADRIDRAPDGLAIVDYKTGKAPSPTAVAAGYAMQLGLLGLIADRGGFPDVTGTSAHFEYWSLAKDGGRSFGKRSTPFAKGKPLQSDAFVATVAAQFTDVAARWLTGDAPFTAKLVPEHATYDDYDQLMRRDEWYGRDD